MSTETRMRRLGIPPGLGPEETRRRLDEIGRRAEASFERARQARQAPQPEASTSASTDSCTEGKPQAPRTSVAEELGAPSDRVKHFRIDVMGWAKAAGFRPLPGREIPEETTVPEATMEPLPSIDSDGTHAARRATIEDVLKAADQGEQSGFLTKEEAQSMRDDPRLTLAEYELLEGYRPVGSPSDPTPSPARTIAPEELGVPAEQISRHVLRPWEWAAARGLKPLPGREIPPQYRHLFEAKEEPEVQSEDRQGQSQPMIACGTRPASPGGEMRRDSWFSIAALVTLILVFAFIWPGPFRYDKMGNYPVRTNRFTGRTEVFRPSNGWEDRAPADSPLPSVPLAGAVGFAVVAAGIGFGVGRRTGRN